jgi:hypothetical protein
MRFTPAVDVAGQTAAWVARLSVAGTPVTLLRFDQRLVRLALHAGSVDPGGSGWRYGAAVGRAERPQLVAGFNGGFKFATGAGGFVADGRVGAPLQRGAGSIVTYRDGITDIGAWRAGVPAPGRPVASVRQDLGLLVDHGSPAASVACSSCWGATLGGGSDVARSALGITASGQLVWAGAGSLSVGALAAALTRAHVLRAVQLDINPEWVAGYFYVHHGRGPRVTPVPMVPGQNGIPGFLLAPYSRDYFTVLSRR